MLLNKLLNKFQKQIKGIKTPILALIGGFTLLLFVLVLTYFTCWLMWEGKLSELLALIHELISPAGIAAVTFIAGCCIDSDKDGVPDIINKAIEIKDRVMR